MGGFSILPHGNFPILEAITRVYLQRKNYVRLLTVLSSHIERPEAERVWTALFRLFPYIRMADKAELEKFYRALFNKYPNITASAEAVVLFAHIHWSVPDLVRDALSNWEKSSSDFVQQAYGELAGLLSLMRPELDWPAKLVSNILASDSSSPTRTGAAFAGVHVWAEMPEKTEAPKLIRDLTKNASNDTFKAVIDLFRLVDEITPGSGWVEILRTIADEIPRQSQFMSSFVIERLQTLLPHEAELVAKISRALVEKWSTDLGDLRTAHASIAPELVDIAITLHRLGPRTREAGLEVFEQLLVIDAYTARETLDQVDNRFRISQAAPRRRLPRRVARTRRANRRKAS